MFTYAVMAVLEGFHHSISTRITVMMAVRCNSGEWEWDCVDVALEATGLWLIRKYLRRRQEIITDYVVGRPIYNMCSSVDRM